MMFDKKVMTAAEQDEIESERGRQAYEEGQRAQVAAPSVPAPPPAPQAGPMRSSLAPGPAPALQPSEEQQLIMALMMSSHGQALARIWLARLAQYGGVPRDALTAAYNEGQRDMYRSLIAHSQIL